MVCIPFVPLLGKINRTYLVLLPQIYFIFLSGYGVYYFNFQFYISSLLVPFLYFLLGTNIETTARAKRRSEPDFSIRKKVCVGPKLLTSTKLKYDEKPIVLFVLISVVCISLFYAPFGPFNSTSISGQNLNAYYNFENNIHITNNELGADKFASLIPFNSTVLIQNNSVHTLHSYLIQHEFHTNIWLYNNETSSPLIRQLQKSHYTRLSHYLL